MTPLQRATRRLRDVVDETCHHLTHEVAATMKRIEQDDKTRER